LGLTTRQPLSDDEGEFCPLLTKYLDGVERLGIAVVLFQPIVNRYKGTHGPARLFKLRDARSRVRAAARAAGLPDWLTLDACRRAGLNEIADSDMTETQEMAMSGHTTPNASDVTSSARKLSASLLLASSVHGLRAGPRTNRGNNSECGAERNSECRRRWHGN
jgi:hypothetical protein